MADIAFLLLIFFLVTTTIDADKGIYMQLPPKLDENNPPPEINQRNLLNVLVNADGQVPRRQRGGPTSRPSGNVVKRHITNRGRNPELSVSPDKAVTSVQDQRRGLSYENYIGVLDEIKSAYAEVRDEARPAAVRRRLRDVQVPARRGPRHGGETEEDVIADEYPLKISLAEPDPD